MNTLAEAAIFLEKSRNGYRKVFHQKKSVREDVDCTLKGPVSGAWPPEEVQLGQPRPRGGNEPASPQVPSKLLSTQDGPSQCVLVGGARFASRVSGN